MEVKPPPCLGTGMPDEGTFSQLRSSFNERYFFDTLQSAAMLPSPLLTSSASACRDGPAREPRRSGRCSIG
ncbi:hypothetical protein CDS [Bradyrhizobium sp.]|nr:hypothetical protein CDS [Bradyrhizobium sp.]